MMTGAELETTILIFKIGGISMITVIVIGWIVQWCVKERNEVTEDG